MGGLLLLPNTELATTKQIAEFYQVDQSVIRQLAKRNHEDLENNGMKVTRFSEFNEIFKSDGLLLYNVTEYGIGKRGATVYTNRAILNVEFLLRDSVIALEVRNQALNIILNATDEQKVYDINQEKALYKIR